MPRLLRTKAIEARKASACLAGAVLLCSSSALAQQGAASLFREVHYSLSGNVALVNDYLFRGKSLSDGKPAIQGGLDYTGIQSVFLGAWGSSGSRSIPVEFDLYAGVEPAVNDWASIEVAVTACYPHAMDESSWEGKVALIMADAAIAYQYDFILKQPKSIWDGDVQLAFALTDEFVASMGIAYHEEDGTTAIFGVRTEFEFLSWR